MTTEVDVAIVGGGAAGIAAARRLQDRHCAVLLVEALPRLGGRARTALLDGMPADLGCGWLHSADRNPLAALAAAQQRTLDRRDSAWGKQYSDLGFPADDRAAARACYEAFTARLRTDPPASDRAADALPRDHRWRPFVDGLSSFVNGTDLDGLSAADFIAYEDASTDDNWRLPDGYGAFLADLGAAVPTACATRATAIREDGDIVVETDRGTIRARAAIVTVSTAVLASGAIRLPPAADAHRHAAAGLPLGLANKVFLRMADPDALPPESHLLGNPDRARTGSYYIRPFGRPMIECFLGGALAHELERAGEEAAVAFVRGELAHLLGTGFANTLAPLAVTRWAQEPTVGGSYSHALPGHAQTRAVLAEPVSERLCFAGEACSPTDFSTAHGAWQTGLAAADWIARAL